MDKGCEICGADKATERLAPSGGTHEACYPCDKREWAQHAIDLASYED